MYNPNMEITINNNSIVVQQPNEILNDFIKTLEYVDKSKEFQAKRMEQSFYWRNSQALEEIRAQVCSTVYKRSGDTFIIPAGFTDQIIALKQPFEDKRTQNKQSLHFPWVKKPWDLRPYQEEAVEKMKENNRGVICLATGLGKTMVAVHATKAIKKKTLIVVPTINLANQFFEDAASAFGRNRVGIYGGGKKKINDITIGVSNSVSRNIQEFANAGIGLTLFDECHHAPAPTVFDIASALGENGKVFGLTATPYRSDGKDLLITASCGDVLISRDLKWGIENKYLAEPHFFVRRIKTTGQEFKADKLKNYKSHILADQTMQSAIMSDFVNFVNNGIPVLILVDMVEHGRSLAAATNAAFATGEDKNSYSYIEKFNKGEINALIATEGAAGEGIDIKRIKALIMANFAASKGLVMQCIGRALRKLPGKDSCVIFDYIPEGSKMLKRHSLYRLNLYKEITPNVKVI
jgi:superfamily II DNA or RNA helicase